jgi:plastocyanin
MLLAAVVSLTLSTAPPPDSVTVTIRTFAFSPAHMQVRVGGTIVFENRDEIEHTVTLGTPAARSTMPGGTLSGAGTQFRLRVDRAGDIPFFCDRHQFMHGVIHVMP